jgi:hypothetical protein
MNSLSLFLYLADVSSGIAILLLIIASISAIVISVYAMACAEEGYPFKFWLLLVPILCGITAVLIPSKSAMYLIAGSELGEVVITSESGQEILNDVKLAIQQQIKELQK